MKCTHLKTLKWILGMHKKQITTSAKDTGRNPWAVIVTPQCIFYVIRASQATTGTMNTLLHHTFMHQWQLNLTQHSTWSRIASISSAAKPSLPPTISAPKEYLHDNSIEHWKIELRSRSIYKKARLLRLSPASQ